MKIDFYYIDEKYIEYLKLMECNIRGFTRVPNVQYHSGNTKFFYGAVLSVNGIQYYVPVSSKLHNRQDDLIIKIKSKSNSVGTLRFQYMIPVPKQCLSLLIRDELNNRVQQERIRKELAFCRRNRERIERQALKTYERVITSVSEELVHNSCDFKLLESAYYDYCNEHNIELSEEEQEYLCAESQNDFGLLL